MEVKRSNALIRIILSKQAAESAGKRIKPKYEFYRQWQRLKFSSQSKQDDNVAALRNTGKSAYGRRRAKEEEKSKLDYRYRKQNDSNLSASSRWGGKAIHANAGRQGGKKNENVMSQTGERVSKKGFISLFDEVDARMGKTSHQRIFTDGIDKKIEVPNSSETDNQSLASFFQSLNNQHSLSSTEGSMSNSTGNAEPLPFISAYLASIEKNKGQEESIFDTFSKSNVQARDPDAFDEETFNQYQEMVKEITEQKRFLKDHTNKPISPLTIRPVVDWLLRHKTIVKYELQTLSNAIEQGLSTHFSFTKDKKSNDHNMLGIPDEITKQFRRELDMQKNDFLKVMKFTPEQYDLALRVLKLLSDRCAKQLKAAPIDIAWEKIKEAGMIPNDRTMSTYLYVVSTASGSSLTLSSFLNKNRHQGMSSLFSSSSSSKVTDNAILDILNNDAPDVTGSNDSNKYLEIDKTVDVPQEVAIFHDMLYQPTEKSISLRVKGLVAKGDAKMAQELLDAFPTKDEIRLRTYLPVLRLYCEKGDVSSALKLFKRMRDTPTVLLEPENYILVISAIAENGYFRYKSKEIEGATEIGYSAASGPLLFDELVGEMSEDILEISSASARRLYNAFATGFEGEEIAQHLKPMHSLAGMSPDNTRAKDESLVASRVVVDNQTAICPVTDARLRLIVLEKQQRKQLHDSLLNLSETQFVKFGGKKSNLTYASRELNKFAEWLNTRKGKPFTAIIDGANVAYYMQNFDQGKFNYYQIEFMVNALEQQNENPLVILPTKYFSRSFFTTTGGSYEKQILSKKELSILKSLTDSGRLFKVPAGCLDDYYWMLASVSEQAVSRNGVDIDVAPDNTEGRWPGTRPMLITNDQMRDHRLELMEQRLFRRWYSCHIVNYNFTAFVDDECIDKEIGFSTADFFSREIQGNRTTKLGTDCNGGTAWHFPVKDWDLSDRFCIRIPFVDKSS